VSDSIARFLPLTESTCYILMALIEPRHGYALMQKVVEMSEGTVSIGPGTLYTAFSTLEQAGLIVKVGEKDRRKTYALTDMGTRVLKEHLQRTEILLKNGRALSSG
jgi:DNA-binding PadR family transcriptional regulator